MTGPNAKSPVSPFATRVTQTRAALDFYIGVKEHVVHSGFAWRSTGRSSSRLSR